MAHWYPIARIVRRGSTIGQSVLNLEQREWFDMEWVIALLALTAMEIVLGIDNIVFITIISAKLPLKQQPLARRLGLTLALGTRLLLLFTLSWIVGMTTPIFELTQIGIPESWIMSWGHCELGDEAYQALNGISWRDVILFGGGLFLVGKSVYEIHDEFAAEEHQVEPSSKMFASVLVQIALLDIVFSLDSVITAVGMVDDLWVMCTAIILAVGVMLVFAEPVSRFVEGNPTLKMLALSFLILIGVMLIAEGAGAHVDKGYIYFAMFFALLVEIMNLSLRKRKENAPTPKPETQKQENGPT